MTSELDANAWQLPVRWPEGAKHFPWWLIDADTCEHPTNKHGLAIKTSKGTLLVEPGNWIVRGDDGEIYVQGTP